MDGGAAIPVKKVAVGDRSFAEEVRKLQMGAGEEFHGETILCVTKALLQAGVSYIGGYPGAPMSHLIDVMADAKDEILDPMGIQFEQSASEAAAATAASRTRSTRIPSPRATSSPSASTLSDRARPTAASAPAAV